MTRASLLALLAVSAVASVGSTGCKYDPHPKDGALRCGPAGECPDGYTCLQTGRCWSNGNSGPTTLLGCDGRTSFAANAQVVRSCVLRVGCSPYEPVRSISDCVTLNTQNAAPGTRCNLKSTTCADFQKCEGFGIAGSDLCSNQAGGRCAGSKAVNCDSTGASTNYFIDCAVAGGTCQTAGTGANAIADCRVVSGCTDTDGASHCSGNFSYVCAAGAGYGFSCGADGYCFASDGRCYLSGTSSCLADSDTCVGKVWESCSTPDLFRFDCSSVGLGCGVDSTGAPWCLAPGCTFADDYRAPTCAESCNGTELTLCYGGVPYTVNCQNYGFTKCFDGLSSNNVDSYATCAN